MAATAGGPKQEPPKQGVVNVAAAYAQDKPALIAHLALLAISLAPLVVKVDVNINIVVTAALTVYAGSWRSVKATPPEDSMTKKDAMRFPLVGSCVLFGLFLLFKFVEPWLVNALLSLYLGGIAVVVLTSALLPYLNDFFPESIRHHEVHFPKFKIPYLFDNSNDEFHPSVPELILAAISLGFCAWYYFKKHWLANNILALGFSLEGIEHLSLGSFQVGCILLCGLFFYDIFWVFCTPVMVSVAKNFDGPIKLLFPRGQLMDNGKPAFAMLGLGDIVIPGIFVALILRYDVQRHFKSHYFKSVFAGYCLGLGTTIVVMNVFKAAQPALLYIVPGVLGCVAVHAAVRGELSQLWHYSEVPEKHEEEVKGDVKEGEAAGTVAVTGDAAAQPAEAKKDK